MRKFKVLAASVIAGFSIILAVATFASAAQEVTTWSHIMTGISAEFEAGQKGTGSWGTDTSKVITGSWVAIQNGAEATVQYAYSTRVSTTSVGRYKAKKEALNDLFVTTYKYYGWYY